MPEGEERPDRIAARRRRRQYFAGMIIGSGFMLFYAIERGVITYRLTIYVLVSLVLAMQVFARREHKARCRRCGHEWSMQPVGRRRTGFVRLQCRNCGHRRWGTIGDD